jgi:hypothetical protein
MSNNGFITPNQPIRSRSPATPRRRSLRVTDDVLADFAEFDALVARNPVPILALPPWTPVRQNAIRFEDIPAAPRRIVRAGLRRMDLTQIMVPGGEPVTPEVSTPPPAPRIRRARSPSSTEPPAKRFRFEREE